MSILNEQPQTQETVFGLKGDSKTMFILGLAVGVGAMALLALVAIIALLLNGTSLNTAKAAGTNTNNQPNVAANNNNADPSANQPPAGPVPEVTKADHIRGKADAKVTIIEYSDYQCPFCQKHEKTMQQIAKDFPNDVRIIYRHFPLSSIHPFAQKASEASECASAQGKFWEMHDQLFILGESASGLTIDGMKKIAADLKLDTGKFNNCLDKGEMANVVNQMYQDGATAGVSGTPANFVNGQLLEGALPYDQFKQAISAAGGKG